ncbi:MAG: cysteine desulfurase family protein [Candidatus Diapherotrites archaeon]|nr:cysteine desulfurase family protein [Candidatus Diapherotrites archaeon]
MKKPKEIYLDYSATTPVREEVLKEALPYFSEKFGNPSSFHSRGLEAKNAIESARKRIAKILNCEAEEIIFCGSGTESINLAIKGIAFRELAKGKRGHFITQKTEHEAVLKTMDWLKRIGFEITYLNVDENGLIDLGELTRSIKEDTLLVSIMYANNEVGTIQPIKEIAEICHKKNTLLHTDACQASEYLDLNVKKLGADLMTLNGSKVYSFKGTGLLYKRKEIEIEALIHGGGQESGARSGTENVPGIVALAKALEIAEWEKKKEAKRITALRDYFIKRVEKEIPKAKLNGHRTKRLPNNVNFSFEGIEGESLILYMNEEGVRLSTGSACSSKSLDPSHVLTAMGIDHGTAHGSIRFSLGKETTKKELDFVIGKLKEKVEFLRRISPVWKKGKGVRKK